MLPGGVERFLVIISVEESRNWFDDAKIVLCSVDAPLSGKQYIIWQFYH